MASPMGGVSPPSGCEASLGSATPATSQRGDGGQPQQPPPLDAEPRDVAHGSGVLFEEAQANSEPADPTSSSHGVAGADDALVILIKLRWPDASPRCQPADCLLVGARGEVVWARPHHQDQLCRVSTLSSVGVWVGRSPVGVSCTRPSVHGGLATHRVRVPPSQPELPGPRGHRLRPGWGQRPGKKCVDQAFACLCMRGR
jgi:hypothetical protein